MSISINKENFKKQSFSNESELQKYLYDFPYLLENEDDSTFYSLAREVRLPTAGIIDLLLLDETGTVIITEVKLSRNGQSRREVLAQIFDYVSELSSLNYYELDEMLIGRLEELCLRIDEEGKLPRTISSLLKNGAIKVIIAIDEVNDDLKRIMEFVNDRTNLDVRLVEISKYDQGNILVPKIVVEGNSDEVLISHSKRELPINESFEEIASSYNSMVQEELQTRNNHRNYRKINPSSWPASLHYEILDKKSKKSVGLEIHLESNQVKRLQQIIMSFEGQEIDGRKLIYDPNWLRKRGRVYVDFEYSLGSKRISQNLFELINLTKDSIEVGLKSLNEMNISVVANGEPVE